MRRTGRNALILVTQIPVLTARLKATIESRCYQESTPPDQEPVRLLMEQLEQLGYKVTLERLAA
jgi:hypothetical protein